MTRKPCYLFSVLALTLLASCGRRYARTEPVSVLAPRPSSDNGRNDLPLDVKYSRAIQALGRYISFVEEHIISITQTPEGSIRMSIFRYHSSNDEAAQPNQLPIISATVSPAGNTSVFGSYDELKSNPTEEQARACRALKACISLLLKLNRLPPKFSEGAMFKNDETLVNIWAVPFTLDHGLMLSVSKDDSVQILM